MYLLPFVLIDAAVKTSVEAGENYFVGVPLGILVGIVTGVIFVSLVGLLRKARTYKAIGPITSRLLALPFFWVGGNFLTGVLLAGELSRIRASYLTALAISFVVVVGYPVAAYVIRVGSEFGQ